MPVLIVARAVAAVDTQAFAALALVVADMQVLAAVEPFAVAAFAAQAVVAFAVVVLVAGLDWR